MSNSWFVRREECPACASKEFETIYESPYDEGPVKDYLIEFYTAQGTVEHEYLEGAFYVLCKCGNCKMIFQRDIPGDTLMGRLYGHWIDPKKVFNQHEKDDGLIYYSNYAQEIMQAISYFNASPSSLSFFDFGMGWAKWSLMAKAFGCHSFGTEISEDRIKYAESIGIKNITWDEIPQNRFDLINTENVFEHIAEPLNTLRHLKTALKPGGLIKINVPTANDIDRRIKIMDWKSPKGSANSLNPVAPLEHINYFRRSSLIKMAAEAQMEEVRIPIGNQYTYTTGWHGIKGVAKNLLRPIYLNLLNRHNYIFLRYIKGTKKN